MIEIKITGDTAKEPEKATEALEKAQEVKLPAEQPKAPRNETSAKSEPVSPMVKQFAAPDGSNVKQCVKAEDFGTIKQKVAEFIQKDKAANSKALKQFLADHGSHKLSEEVAHARMQAEAQGNILIKWEERVKEAERCLLMAMKKGEGK